MKFETRLEVKDVTAGIAEAITGVGTALQRNWRRRGYLPEIEKGRNARLNGETLAYLTLLQKFSMRGVDPNDFHEEAYTIAPYLIYFAIAHSARKYPQDHFDDESVAQFKGFPEDFSRPSADIAAAVFRKITRAPQVVTFPRFYVWASDGVSLMTDDLNDTFCVGPTTADEGRTVGEIQNKTRIIAHQFSGPALVLDLSVIGQELAEKARHWCPLYEFHCVNNLEEEAD